MVGMEFSSLRNVMVVDPFTGTKKSTAAKGKKWEEVAANLDQFQC